MAEKGSREGSEEAAPGPEAVTPALGVAADTDGASLACPGRPSCSATGLLSGLAGGWGPLPYSFELCLLTDYPTEELSKAQRGYRATRVRTYDKKQRGCNSSPRHTHSNMCHSVTITYDTIELHQTNEVAFTHIHF